MAPFFLFQVICLFLWSLDDYWYYSAFTLLMLMFFEAMLCRQRLASLQMLRNMRRAPIPILVYRNKRWELASSDSLVPGDVISLTSTFSTRGRGQIGMDDTTGMIIPCDAILLHGSCVVNEAMLTGESVPQLKDPLSTSDLVLPESLVDFEFEGNADPTLRRHVLMGGTTLMQHSSNAADDPKLMIVSEDIGIQATPPSPSDGGCVAVVIRTGFATVQV